MAFFQVSTTAFSKAGQLSVSKQISSGVIKAIRYPLERYAADIALKHGPLVWGFLVAATLPYGIEGRIKRYIVENALDYIGYAGFKKIRPILIKKYELQTNEHHYTYWDGCTVGFMLPRIMRFLAKKLRS